MLIATTLAGAFEDTVTKTSAFPKEATVSPKIKKPDKREAIIEAATDLFTNEGYETTTIAEVARKAGVAVGTVYLYFKNKQEMLYAVKEQWDAEFMHYMVQAGLNHIPHQQRIRAIVENCFKACIEHTERVQLMGLPPQVMGEIYHSQHQDHTGPIMEQAIKNWLDEAIADGVFRPMNTEAAAVISYSMVSGALEQCFQVENGNSQEQELYINMLVDALERWVLRSEFL